MKETDSNKKAFTPVGICFLGAGVALWVVVGPGAGIALLTLGIIFIAKGNQQKKTQD